MILYGHQACGKTYFGKLLAEKLGCPFIDTDKLIEDHFQEPCRMIAKKRGEPFFRQVEAETIQNLSVPDLAVIAIGGGTLLNEASYIKLKTIGMLVYLELDRAQIKQRVFASGTPAYLDPVNPEDSFEKIYEERRKIYETLSPYKVSLSEKSDFQIINELKTLFKNPSLK